MAASSSEIGCTTPSAALIRHFAGAFRRVIAAVAWRCRYVKRQTEVLAEKIGLAEAMGAKVGRSAANQSCDRSQNTQEQPTGGQRASIGVRFLQVMKREAELAVRDENVSRERAHLEERQV